LVEIAIIGLLAVVPKAPDWRLTEFDRHSEGRYLGPVSWNPRGDMVLATVERGFDVLRSDGSVVVRDQPGTWPTWVGDTTLIVLDAVDQPTVRLIRVELPSGHRQTIGQPLPAGGLIGDGRGRLAHQTFFGERRTTVLDPTTGAILESLDGFRATLWTSDGELVLKEQIPGLENRYPDGGSFVVWRPGQPAWRLSPNVVELQDTAVLAPDGDRIACVCWMPQSPGQPWPWVFEMDLDGTGWTRVIPWRDQPRYHKALAWVDDETLAMLDSHGLTTVTASGHARRLLDVASSFRSHESLLQAPGSLFRLDGALAATLSPQKERATVIVVDDNGSVRTRLRFHALNTPRLVVNQAGTRAIVVPGGQRPDEWTPNFLLDLR
jgi:hypothetical protein